MHLNELIQLLETADPEIARTVKSVFERRAYAPDEEACARLADEILWALGHEYHFGKTVAEGNAELMGRIEPARLETYRQKARAAAANGPTLGQIVAAHLTPVMLTGDDALFDLFFEALATLLKRGSLSLTDPLQALSDILRSGDMETPVPYLRLLISLFANELDFNQTKYYAKTIPRSVLDFPPAKRPWQTKALLTVTEIEYPLVNALLTGFGRGLERLAENELQAFVAQGLERHNINPALGRKFFALDSRLGLETCRELQRSATLGQVQDQLRQYVKARTGRGVAVRSFADAPKGLIDGGDSQPGVYSDGQAIYLPAEIGCYSLPSLNRSLYKCLVRLETGFYEYGTYDFDLERLADCHPEAFNVSAQADDPENAGDSETFFRMFSNPRLAEEIFAVIETGRIWNRFRKDSPGLVARATPFIHEAAGDFHTALACLHHSLTVGHDSARGPRFPETLRQACGAWTRIVHERLSPQSRVEDAASLTARLYPDIAAFYPGEVYRPMRFPFDCRPRPEWTAHAFRDFDRISRSLQNVLSNRNIHIYRSDIRKLLIDNSGMLSPDKLQHVIRNRRPEDAPASSPGMQGKTDFPDEQALADILESQGVLDSSGREDENEAATRYPEWDCRLNDYLNGYVRLVEKSVPDRRDAFYRETLERHSGLVRHIRHAFEMLRPEGLVRLRRWRDGDELDYREMLNFAVDRKSGRMPSDRLYIKRLKQQRDVAVLLLVDLSRSTAHPVNESGKAVLDVEKEAIVLFCEALEVVGDRYAVAGFSGTGRLAVDYFRIKDFGEDLNETVRGRISAMSPQRNTRMGAAIRHATQRIGTVDARLRLLMILGDGFPNDAEYKQNYAVTDTRMAVNEARARNIHVHAITVNMAADEMLDDLYGRVHHNVIADVRELPDKLMRIYGRMTCRA